MHKIICAIICGVLALISLVISVMSFKEKGFLFNNAYISASKQERDKMDKKLHYWQSAIVFALFAAILICLAVEVVLATGWLLIGVGAICIAALVYAFKSSIE